MTSRACRVFISHSAHPTEEPDTEAFLHALVTALQGVAGVEPIADRKDLKAGDAWMQQLYSWMGLCDACVILLSPRAVTRENSAWVPRETNLLLWRKALDPGFVVIPVLLGGLVADDLKASPFLADVRLRDLQFADGLDDAGRIAAIVAEIERRLACRRARLAFDPVRVFVEDCLQRFAPADSIAATLADQFGDDPWQPQATPPQRLALKMVRSASTEGIDRAIHQVTLGSQGDSRLGRRLFECLFPMRLPAAMASQLLRDCIDQEGRGSVLLNAHDTWAVNMLLASATGLPRDDFRRTWQLIELPDGWGDNDLAEATRVLAEELSERMLGTGSWDTLSDQDDPQLRLQEQLAELNMLLAEARQDRQAPVLVCAAFRPRWIALAEELVQRFPTTVFIFWTGDEIPALPQGSGNFAALDPAWKAGEDRRWQRRYQLKLGQFGAHA